MSNFTLTESGVATNVSIDTMINAGEHSLVEQRSIIVLFLFLLIIVIGVPGNFLIIVVFWTKPRKTSTAVLIMALAVTDLVSCLARIPDTVFAVLQLDGSPPSYILIGNLVITLTNNLSLTVADGLTALIAFDRYDCVCRHNRRLLSHRRSRLAVALVLCLSLVTNIPLCLYAFGDQRLFTIVLARQIVSYSLDVLVVVICYGRVYATIKRHVRVGLGRKRAGQPGISDSLGGRLTEASQTGLPSRAEGDDTQMQVVREATDKAPDRATAPTLARKVSVHQNQEPLGIAVVSSSSGQPTLSRVAAPREGESLGGVRPREHASAARGGQPSNSMQRKTTRMLFSVTLIFLVTYIPYWIYVSFLLSGRPPDLTMDIVYNLLNLLFLNNAVNPLIYGLANRRFRKDIRDVLRKFFRRGVVSMEQ